MKIKFGLSITQIRPKKKHLQKAQVSLKLRKPNRGHLGTRNRTGLDHRRHNFFNHTALMSEETVGWKAFSNFSRKQTGFDRGGMKERLSKSDLLISGSRTTRFDGRSFIKI